MNRPLYDGTKKTAWWLKKDCRKCKFYPNCDNIETNFKEFGFKFPRGCSDYQDIKVKTI